MLLVDTHNLVQTVLLEYSRLPSKRRSLDRSSDDSSERRIDCGSRDGGSRGPHQSYTPRRFSSSGPTSRFLPEHHHAFLTKSKNVVRTDPNQAFTPDCICCLALNLREALRKHMFTDCPYATDNEHCKKTFISMCHLVNG